MDKKLKKRLRIIALLTTLIWMAIIFKLSMDTGVESHTLSDTSVNIFNNLVLRFTGKDLTISITPEHYALIELFFRKLAHMTIYFVLSINVMIVLFTFNMKMYLRIFISVFLCFIYAISDEFHQLLVDGRTANIMDVFIDTAGVIIGVLVALVLYCICYTIMIKYQNYKANKKTVSIKK